MSGKQIAAVCTVLVALIGVPTAFFGMMRGCHDVGKSAAERRKAEEELERLRREREAAERPAGGAANVPPAPQGPPAVLPKSAPPTNPAPPVDLNAVVDTVEVNDTVFKLQSVKWSGDDLVVWYTATSLGKNREYHKTYSPAATLIDNEGNTHTRSAELGEWPIANSVRHLPADVPVKCGVQFRNVARSAKTIAAFQTAYASDYSPGAKPMVRFKNIPIPAR